MPASPKINYLLSLNPETYNAIKKCCEKRKMKMSDFIRLAISKELSIYSKPSEENRK